MEFWNNVITTAMIGTDKKVVGAADLPEALAEPAGLIIGNSSADREQVFLQLASLANNYRQCGLMPLKKEQATITPALAEEEPYCSPAAHQVLKDILHEESIPLLKLWLHYCGAKKNIVYPELLPNLLPLALQHKNLQTIVARCSGKRGEWLSRFNTAWDFSTNQSEQECWLTGTPEQRKTVLKEKFEGDPTIAREWLAQTWSQEDANTKAAFLDILSGYTSYTDIPFLTSLSTEKSKKIKDQAVAILKQIPGSPVVIQYQQLLEKAVWLKKEKVLLGLTSKMVLQLQLPEITDDSIFKTGIEKLSNNKEFTDDEFIIFQLIRSVPPSFWEKQLAANPESIIGHFQKDPIGKKMIPALIIAISKFKAHDWAFAFMQYSPIFYIDLIPLLPIKQQDFYSNKFFTDYPDSIIQHAVQSDHEWNVELTKNIFRHASGNIYQYNRSFYNQVIHLIPVAIIPQLPACAPAEQSSANSWAATSEYVSKLLHLKAAVLQSFN